MNKKINGYSFLAIGKTQESTDAQEFARYIGLGSSFVLAVNPDKKQLDELRGFDSQNEPEYIKDGEQGKEAHINFVVKTDPEVNNGIEVVNLAMFTLRLQPAYNRDQTKVQVIDKYGNYTWADAETAKSGATLPANCMIDQQHYRMACVGECDLVAFLKKYLGVPNSLNYVNGSWVLADKAADGIFGLEHIKDYFTGDFSELREALALQPNNKVKLLYGVRTTDDGKQYQAIATRGDLILRNSAGSNAIAKLERDLKNIKDAGSYSNTEFRVQELQEYKVEPTNLEKPAQGGDGLPFAAPDNTGGMPWD